MSEDPKQLFKVPTVGFSLHVVSAKKPGNQLPEIKLYISARDDKKFEALRHVFEECNIPHRVLPVVEASGVNTGVHPTYPQAVELSLPPPHDRNRQLIAIDHILQRLERCSTRRIAKKMDIDVALFDMGAEPYSRKHIVEAVAKAQPRPAIGKSHALFGKPTEGHRR
jgi:hypothetical protein